MSHDLVLSPIMDARPCIVSTLKLLLLGALYAEETGAAEWDFATEIEQLTALGMTFNDFRWMVKRGLVKHQCESTSDNDDGRRFRSTGNLTFPVRTCFVLTDLGIEIARKLSLGKITTQHAENAVEAPNNSATEYKFDHALDTNQILEGQLPIWDAERRVLAVNNTIVKQFKWIAANQQTVLCAFEEEGWPARIDDPLPPHPEQDSKRRLGDTIKCLNRKQCNPLILFRGDGTGEGVIWEIRGRTAVNVRFLPESPARALDARVVKRMDQGCFSISSRDIE